MPKVTDEHRAARRQQILGAALRCAAREGFHKTTMSAVVEESGLSAGAVYLYFKNKQDLIRALAQIAVGGVAGRVEELAAAEPVVRPDEALAAVARRVLEIGEELDVELPRLALQAWAEAARDAEIRGLISEEAIRIRAAWLDYTRGAVAAGHLRPGADPERVGQTLMSMLPGFMVVSVVIGGVTPEEYASGLREMLE